MQLGEMRSERAGMKLDEMRPGIRTAFDLIQKRLREGKPTTSIVLPTRYGKRDLVITSAFQAVRDGIVSGAIVFSPATQATRQYYREKKLMQTILRYEMSVLEVMGGIRQFKSFSEYQPFSNGEFLLAANIQLCLRANIDDAVELVDAERERTRKPMVIFIDECQFVSDKKRWGEFFGRMVEAGALLVLLTATPYREDTGAIPGFHYTLIKDDDERRYFVSDAGDGVHNRIDVFDGVRTLSMLDADHVTTFREAWATKPTVLCSLAREVINVEVDIVIDGKVQSKKLKELSATDAKKYLGKVVRDERFLRPAVKAVLDKLEHVRRLDPRTKAMICTGSDQPNDDRDNAQAEACKCLLVELGPAILGRKPKVRIVTMKSEEDGSLATAIEEFQESDDDVVIVKQAGVVGLDEWKIKVQGYFTSIRSVSNMIQTWMRVATPEGGLKVGHVIMPDDCICIGVWDKLIVKEGGEEKLSEISVWEPADYVDSYLKKKEEKPRTELRFGPGSISGFDDSSGNVGDMGLYEVVTRLFQRIPHIGQNCTPAEVAVALKESGHAANGVMDPMPWGLDRELDKQYEDVVEIAKEKTNSFMKQQTGGRYDKGVYEEIIRKIYTHAKRVADVPMDVELRHIKTVETLKTIKRAIENISDIPKI